MTVRDLLAALQHLPRGAEVLAMEAGCEEYCERELDLVELEGAGCTCTSGFGGTNHRTASQARAPHRWVPQ